jgi:hypothetical protein
MGDAIAILTTVHVAISLVAIAAGFVVVYGFLTDQRLDGWTATFLTTTVLTSVTGFLFPFNGITPGLVVGVLSLLVLAVAILARYHFHLAGPWRATYVISSVVAFYFNFFVLVVQMFAKIPALKELAPTQSEPPFVATQLIVLLLFVVFGIAGVRKFRGEPMRTGLA